IFRLGIRSLLPETIQLISGPGCPVCVTPCNYIDEAITLALDHKVTLCTFGDLIRVPGSASSLARSRTAGAVIQTVYSPLDALHYAEEHPEEQVCFLAVGFETTTPGACLAVKKASSAGVKNFTLLTANKTMPNAYKALQGSADAFLFPGHVHAIIGTSLCETLCREQGVSGVVAGFTAEELLTALSVIVCRAQEGKAFFENCYSRVVRKEGNPAAAALIREVMEECDTQWRGLGTIPMSGLQLRKEWEDFDARKRFALGNMEGKGNPACRCGEILQGKIKPCDCPLFGKVCTPLHPVGACMVSNEGACSAYYQYGDLKIK
ncbi:MAG: hydrogenase formation protein HypD, partial [Lentisphaeria bacterium]|nr:hydrogenase formation protein HypD [Lentisphaeria bacterium]